MKLVTGEKEEDLVAETRGVQSCVKFKYLKTF